MEKGKGPTKCGANFLDSTLRGRSRVTTQSSVLGGSEGLEYSAFWCSSDSSQRCGGVWAGPLQVQRQKHGRRGRWPPSLVQGRVLVDWQRSTGMEISWWQSWEGYCVGTLPTAVVWTRRRGCRSRCTTELTTSPVLLDCGWIPEERLMVAPKRL